MCKLIIKDYTLHSLLLYKCYRKLVHLIFWRHNPRFAQNGSLKLENFTYILGAKSVKSPILRLIKNIGRILMVLILSYGKWDVLTKKLFFIPTSLWSEERKIPPTFWGPIEKCWPTSWSWKIGPRSKISWTKHRDGLLGTWILI